MSYIDYDQQENWYIVQTYSGHEKKVSTLLKQRAKSNGVEDEIVEVVIPTQEKILVSDGKKRKKEEKIFPGYILVKMKMTEMAYKTVRNTDGVTGFVGTEKKPTPLSAQEVENILAFAKVEQPAYSASFSVGDAVKVLDGPFKDFVGSIDDINEDKGQVKVMLSIFGRETPVVLDFLQVSKL
jgi:transcriptional antiterminator NusG